MASLIIPNLTGTFEGTISTIENLDMDNFKVTDVALPTLNGDAANKQYVDNLISTTSAVSYTTVDLGTTLGDLSGYVYSSGASKTLSNAGTLSIDNTTPAVSDLILVKDQTTKSENGIYIVTVVGPGAILTRVPSYDQTGEFTNGLIVRVNSTYPVGTTNYQRSFIIDSLNPIILDTDDINFEQINNTGLSAGDNINISGPSQSVVELDNNIFVDNIQNTTTKANEIVISQNLVTVENVLDINNFINQTGGAGGAVGCPCFHQYLDGNSYPAFQLMTYNHDSIHMSFDAYWEGGDYKSSDVGSNFEIGKFGDAIQFRYDSGVTAGDVLSAYETSAITDTSGEWTFNNQLNVLDTFHQSGTGGSNSNSPRIEQFFDGDANPGFQIFSYNHDNINLVFDAYWNGSFWISSHAGLNFRIAKVGGNFLFQYDSGVTVGSRNTWKTAATVNSGGDWTFHNDINQSGASASGSNVPVINQIFEGETNPVFQICSYSHDNIQLNFDAHWNGLDVISSDLGSNFQIRKVTDLLVHFYDTGTPVGNEVNFSSASYLSASTGKWTFVNPINFSSSQDFPYPQFMGRYSNSVYVWNTLDNPTPRFERIQNFNTLYTNSNAPVNWFSADGTLTLDRNGLFVVTASVRVDPSISATTHSAFVLRWHLDPDINIEYDDTNIGASETKSEAYGATVSNSAGTSFNITFTTQMYVTSAPETYYLQGCARHTNSRPQYGIINRFVVVKYTPF